MRVAEAQEQAEQLYLDEERGFKPMDPVFFDQEGLITTKFGIRSVPAKISQSGRLLQVEEVMP